MAQTGSSDVALARDVLADTVLAPDTARMIVSK
jgi:hypothetical protein